MTTGIYTQTHTCSLATRSGDIIDAGIGWWRIHACRPAIVLTVSGEIDASNTDRFSESVHRQIGLGDPIVVDLSGVDFFGVKAFR
ncbi:MAG: STAS domain-containing protein, partial [Mycolicibacterium sp.]|nr:STAS domain-containing protein [Mycolicibacterium sp.]